jgi:hypothetical protein
MGQKNSNPFGNRVQGEFLQGAIQVPLLAVSAGWLAGPLLAEGVGAYIFRTFAFVSVLQGTEAINRGDYLLGGIALIGGALDLRTYNPYSVAYTAKLSPKEYLGARPRYQFQQANRVLAAALDADPAFAGAMEGVIPGLREQLGGIGGGAFSRKPPAGWTWHHGFEPGTFELMPTWQHRSARFWPILHPENRGGQSRWGFFIQRP